MAGFPHIAVVDDEQAIVDILGYSLKKKFPDSQISGFHDAAEAWEWLKQNDVDLLLTDLNMPEKSGREIVTMMANQSPHTPVIVISGAMSLVELKELEVEFNKVRVFAKPLLTRELIGCIEAELAGDDVLSPERQQQLSLANVLHLMHLQAKSVQVAIEHPSGRGGVILKDGEPVLAEYEGDPSEEAFFKLLQLEDPQVVVEESVYTGEVKITKSFDELFKEYIRRREDA